MSDYQIATLYKYMPYRAKFFDNFLLRCSQRPVLNDPFEILPGLDYLVASECDIAPRPSGRWGSTRDEVRRRFQEALTSVDRNKIRFAQDINDMGVISFSETRDNLLMWAHYADSHRGVLIEFDVRHAFFASLNGESERLARVLYRKQRSQDIYPHLGRPEQVDIYGILFEKSDEWIYEKEHRVSRKLMNADKIYVNAKLWGKELAMLYAGSSPEFISDAKWYDVTELCSSPAQIMIDGADAFFFFQVPPTAIKSVTCGVNMLAEQISQVKSKAEEHGFNCYQALIHDNDYRLEFKPV